MNKNLLLIMFIIFSAAILPQYILPPVCLFTIALFFFYRKEVFRKMKRKEFWIFIFIISFVQPILFGEKDISILGIPYSSNTLWIGISMSLRAIMIMTAFSFLMIMSKAEKMELFWQRVGIGHFDTIFNETQNVLPQLKSLLQNSLTEFKKKNGKKTILLHPIDFAAHTLAKIIKTVNNSTNTKQ